MKRIHLFVAIGALAILAAGGSNAVAGQPGANPCQGGSIGSGTYGSFSVSGFCMIKFGAQITVNGNVTVNDGATFALMFLPGNVHITGNVQVGKGAQFGLGYGTGGTVDGNVTANQPLTLYIGNATINGNLTSNGGGTTDRFFNFPIKDNTIGGNLTVHGWTGGWFGLLRNQVGGNIDVSQVDSMVDAANGEACTGTFPGGCPAGPGGDGDSTEITDNVVAGNVICHNNSPAAQFGDSGGGPNTVAGNKIGECSQL